MTGELRPALDVYHDAADAGAQPFDCILTDCRFCKAAAAVIEADREAVRAEQAAEIERLRKLVTSSEQERYKKCGEMNVELAKFKALAETLAGALDEWVFRYYWLHEGMNTEHARIYAKAQTEMMLRQYKEARDAS